MIYNKSDGIELFMYDNWSHFHVIMILQPYLKGCVVPESGMGKGKQSTKMRKKTCDKMSHNHIQVLFQGHAWNSQHPPTTFGFHDYSSLTLTLWRNHSMNCLAKTLFSVNFFHSRLSCTSWFVSSIIIPSFITQSFSVSSLPPQSHSCALLLNRPFFPCVRTSLEIFTQFSYLLFDLVICSYHNTHRFRYFSLCQSFRIYTYIPQ